MNISASTFLVGAFLTSEVSVPDYPYNPILVERALQLNYSGQISSLEKVVITA